VKPKQGGFYRCLWNESARDIPFSHHTTRKGAETIPQGYRYKGTVSSDYYHHLCVGSKGLEDFARENGLIIDWETEKLSPKEGSK
jgi:hypothetical protein